MSEESTHPETPVEEPVAEEPKDEAPSKAESTSAGGAEFEGAILDELTRFGNRLAAVARQAWESDQRKEVETEVREGLFKAGQRLDQAAQELRTSELTQDLKVQAARAAGKVEESQVTQEIRKGLLVGLRRLNDELSDLLQKTAASESPPPAEGAEDTE